MRTGVLELVLLGDIMGYGSSSCCKGIIFNVVAEYQLPFCQKNYGSLA